MRMRVCIIDDDESVRRSLSRLLRLAGLRPSTFESAEEFLASPERKECGCLVLDIYMARGMSGLELRRQLLESGDHTPVIFWTAHDDEPRQKEATRLGCVAYLRKGSELQSLVEILLRIEATKNVAP